MENNNIQDNEKLANFKAANDKMIATNDNAYSDQEEKYFRLGWSRHNKYEKRYDLEEINKIIEYGTNREQTILSRHYFYRNGLYKRIIMHYGTFLKNSGVLIPNVMNNKSITDVFISKKYDKALEFVEKMKLETLLTHISTKVFIDGTYYGLVQNENKNTFAVIDLPFFYCRNRFKDQQGNDVIEFDVSFFDTISTAKKRKEALSAYPKEVSSYYKRWVKNRALTRWLFISSEVGICFSYQGGKPFFLDTIPTTLEYDDALKRQAEKELEEIKNILVQQIGHSFDGGDVNFVLEPDELEEVHRGTVGMLKKNNPNTAVITTYGEVKLESSKTTSDATSTNSIEGMKNNIYSNAGVSSAIFATNSNLSLETSLNNDMALAMVLGNKYSVFITNLINKNHGNTNIQFKYTILPISWYNTKQYIEDTMKGATTGYSFILPAIAMGITQSDLMSLKNLENYLLKMHEQLIPLQTAYTQSGKEETNSNTTTETVTDNGGRPPLDDSKKTTKTIENQNSSGGGT